MESVKIFYYHKKKRILFLRCLLDKELEIYIQCESNLNTLQIIERNSIPTINVTEPNRPTIFRFMIQQIF